MSSTFIPSASMSAYSSASVRIRSPAPGVLSRTSSAGSRAAPPVPAPALAAESPPASTSSDDSGRAPARFQVSESAPWTASARRSPIGRAGVVAEWGEGLGDWAAEVEARLGLGVVGRYEGVASLA